MALLSSCVLLSLNVPVAVNCCVLPLLIDGFAGVTAIDTSVGGVTVSTVEPVIAPLVAEIVDVPAPTPVARPVALIVATVVVPEAHTALLSTCVLLSLNVPGAVNCSVLPLLIDGFAGNTLIATSLAGVTVSPVEPTILPLVAEIVEGPAATAVAKPVLLIVAELGLKEIAENKPCRSLPRPAVVYILFGSPDKPPPPHFMSHKEALVRTAPLPSFSWSTKFPVAKS